MERTDIVVFSSLNLAEVHLIRSALAREGIPSRIKSNMLAPLAGKVLWTMRGRIVCTASYAEQALQVIRAAMTLDGPDRACPQCQEMNPVSFEVCWNCGSEIES